MTSVAQATTRLSRSIYDIMRAVGRDYSQKGIPLVAAALAFYLFLALFPFLLVIIATLGYVLRSWQEGLDIVSQGLSQALPGSSAAIQQQIEGIVAKRAIVGGLGLIGLIWSASGALAILVHALRIIWETKGRTIFLLARLRALLLVMLAVLLLLLSMAISAVLGVVRHWNAAGFPFAMGELRTLWQLATAALPLAVSFTTFLALYRIVPAPQLKLRDLAVGAAFAAVAWEIAKRGFSYYLVHFANFHRVYGPVGTMVVLMLWIYVSSIIALVGAELAWVYARRRAAEGGMHIRPAAQFVAVREEQ